MKYIKAKYFLIKDYYDSGEIDLRYCPTDVMWADVLTKPLQGQKFRLMNQQAKTVASSQECVGELPNLSRERLCNLIQEKE